MIDDTVDALAARIASLEACNAELKACNAVTEARLKAIQTEMARLRKLTRAEWVSAETYGRLHEHPVVTIRKWIDDGTIAPSDWQREGRSVRIRRDAVPGTRTDAKTTTRKHVAAARQLRPGRWSLKLECGHAIERSAPSEPKKATCRVCGGPAGTCGLP